MAENTGKRLDRIEEKLDKIGIESTCVSCSV